jgi:hypothetical protein
MKKRTIFRLTLILLSASCEYRDLNSLTSNCNNSTLALTVITKTNSSTCSSTDGAVTVAATGGMESYSYKIGGNDYQASDTFNDLASGSYTISVKDALGCVVTQLASINSTLSTLAITVSTTANSGCPSANGTLTVSIVKGTAPFTYKLNSGSYQSSNTFSGLPAGEYSVSVLDSTKCPTTGSGTVIRNGPSFSADILPIITTKCAITSCHNGSISPNLSSYAGVSSNASLINSQTSSQTMPPSNSTAGSLTTDQINLIACWVNDGALNN